MLIRCSSLGKIMTKARNKKDGLSVTAKSYIKEYVLAEKFGIYKEFWSRYTDKGNECEDESIKLVGDVLDVGFIYKNEEHFKNDFISGTPDVNTSNTLIDVKTSWNAITFPWFTENIPNKDYYYQLQGYMWLTGKTESLLVYCLIDTPELMLQDEIRREHWKLNKIEQDEELEAEIRQKHTFDYIPKQRRIKSYLVKYDQQVIDDIKEKVILCREYAKELEQKLIIQTPEHK